jgi:hypothetical protein
MPHADKSFKPHVDTTHRRSVSGEGLPLLHEVRRRLGARAVTLGPEDPGFHALLTTPNCTAAL